VCVRATVAQQSLMVRCFRCAQGEEWWLTTSVGSFLSLSFVMLVLANTLSSVSGTAHRIRLS
jgi:hypothetical protein